jgi:hypothetical protein
MFLNADKNVWHMLVYRVSYFMATLIDQKMIKNAQHSSRKSDDADLLPISLGSRQEEYIGFRF